MNRIFIFFPVIVLLFLMITGCNTNTSSEKATERHNDTLDVATMKKIVEERNLVYGKAFVEGDSITVMDHFTEDARAFPSNAEQVIGKSAIALLISQFLKFGIKEFTDETTRVLGAGEYIIEEGNYFLGGDNGKTLDKGKYICVWKKENGQWKVCSNIWNTSLPIVPEKK
ncbi:MAG: DUF4440 domain-containing protein [Ferruginibacter sp.]